jgi:vitamin B12 transporter
MSKIITPTLILFLCLIPVGLSAQNFTAETDTTLQLGEITVQATKIPISDRETTRPVQIITRAEIEQSGSSNFGQLLQHQSGIRVNGSEGTPGSNLDLFVRGATGEYVLILIDGAAVNDPSGVGGAIDLRLLPLHDIERIEILKGNQSALYGTDALGGVINIITRKASQDDVQLNANVEYGGYRSFNGSGNLNGSFSDKITYKVGYGRTSSSGISAAAAPEGETFKEDGFQRDNYSGSIMIKPSENLSVKSFFNYSDFEGDYDARAFQDAENRYAVTMWNPGISAEYRSERFRFHSTYQFVATERQFNSQFGETPFEGSFKNLDSYVNVEITKGLKALAGINWQDQIVPANEEMGLEKKDASFTSPYATMILRSASGIGLEAGIRFNSHSEYGTNTTYSVSPSFEMNETLKFFASIGTGFKAPTLEQLFGQFGANPNLEPETSKNIELGVESYFAGESLKTEAVYFTRRIDELITFDFASGYLNRDEENVNGFELDLNWIVNSALTLGTYYNYLSGETITLNEAGEIESEAELIRRPNHLFGLKASYRFANGLFLRMDGEYVTERTDLFFDPENNFAAKQVTLDPFLLANAYAGYSLFQNRSNLYLTVRNLFDADFTEVYGFNTLGIHIRGGLRVNL